VLWSRRATAAAPDAGVAAPSAVEQARGSGGVRRERRSEGAGAGGGGQRLELPCEVFYPSDLVFASALDMLHLLASLPAFPSPYPYSRGLPSHGLHAWPYPDLLPHASRRRASGLLPAHTGSQELDAPPAEVAAAVLSAASGQQQVPLLGPVEVDLIDRGRDEAGVGLSAAFLES